MDADGGNLRRLTDDRGYNYKIAPRWSAGGTRIIFGAVIIFMHVVFAWYRNQAGARTTRAAVDTLQRSRPGG